MSGVEVRPFVAEDLDPLARVLVEVHATDRYPVEGVDDPRVWLQLDSPLGQWTALLDEAPVGHVAMLQAVLAEDGAAAQLAVQDGTPIEQVAVLARLFVAPSARKRSVATRLMETVERAARSADLRLVLDVMTKDRTALEIYRKRGWQPIGSFEHQYGDNQRTQAVALLGP